MLVFELNDLFLVGFLEAQQAVVFEEQVVTLYTPRTPQL
ncbi:hypothetical protein B224_3320 [Aeromonas media WS]|nr:hypothetical protein B224_3320 [Aeromonas media WS]